MERCSGQLGKFHVMPPKNGNFWVGSGAGSGRIYKGLAENMPESILVGGSRNDENNAGSTIQEIARTTCRV